MFTSCAAFETRWASTWGCHRNAASIRILFSQRSVFGKRTSRIHETPQNILPKGTSKLSQKPLTFYLAAHSDRLSSAKTKFQPPWPQSISSTVQLGHATLTLPQLQTFGRVRHNRAFRFMSLIFPIRADSGHRLENVGAWPKQQLPRTFSTRTQLHAYMQLNSQQWYFGRASWALRSIPWKANVTCCSDAERGLSDGRARTFTPLRCAKVPEQRTARSADHVSPLSIDASEPDETRLEKTSRKRVCTGVGHARAVSAFCPENGASGELTLEIIGRSVSWAVIPLSQRSSYHYDCYRK